MSETNGTIRIEMTTPDALGVSKDELKDILLRMGYLFDWMR